MSDKCLVSIYSYRYCTSYSERRLS